MRIECLISFKEGVVTFEKDDICTVSDDDGARFCANGWAKDHSRSAVTASPVVGDTNLEINPVSSGNADTLKG